MERRKFFGTLGFSALSIGMTTTVFGKGSSEIQPVPITNPIKKTTRCHVSAKDFREEIIRSQENGELTARAEDMINIMALQITRCFAYRDEKSRMMSMSGAHRNVRKEWRNYDSTKYPNAFAWFTQVLKLGLAKGYRRYQENSLPVNRI